MKKIFLVLLIVTVNLFAGTNESGTISSSVHWNLAGSPYTVTGNITINSSDTLYLDPGIIVYFNNGYSFIVNGTLYAVGTKNSIIYIASSNSLTNTGTYSDYSLIGNEGINANITMAFVSIQNVTTLIVMYGSSGLNFNLSNLYVNCGNSLISWNASNSTIITFKNCLFQNLYTFWYHTAAIEAHLSMLDCHLYKCMLGIYNQINTATEAINFQDCFLDRCGWQTCSPSITVTRCLVYSLCSSLRYIAASTGNSSWVSTIFTKETGSANDFSLNATSGGAHSFTNCDFVMSDHTAYAISNATTPTPILIPVTSCYMAGNNGADINNYFTGSQTPAQVITNDGSHFTFTTPRTTRNFQFLPASITNSTPTNTSDTIKWSTDFKTAHRVLYGKSSANYPYMSYPNQSWSGWDGTMMDTTNAAIPITNLSPGTKYYYVCQSWDWVMETWNQSIENSFTTLGVTPASNDSLLRYIVYHDLDSSNFNRTTGVKTVYNSSKTGAMASWNFTEDGNGIYRSSATITSDTNTIPDSLNSWMYQYRFNAATYRKADSMWCILKTNGTDTLARIKNYNISGYTVHGKAH